MGNRKRLTAFLLTAVMILTMPQMQIAAAEVESPADVGLCIHHTQHTGDCGYTEGEKGTPCGHVHTEDCYAPIKQCVHEHGESCYPVAEDGASENTAENVAEGEPHTCTHECSEESGCITEKLDCPHEHNADCGYSPATEGTPCTYECEACSGQEQINALPNVEDSPRENAEEIAALQAVAADPANKPTEGEGTEQSPYQITNAEELKWFRDTVNSGTTDIHARLLHDIDLKNVSWEPIGTQKKPYTGTFDGNAYIISNFRLGDHTKPDQISEKGLFGWIGSGGTIQDVVVKVENIGSATNPNNFNITKCGLIAAYNAGTIRRCSVMVNYTLYVAGEIGIIAYQNSGIIENCLSAVGTGTGNPKFPGRIPDEASAAGIAYENSGTIKNCLFDGKLRTDGFIGNSYVPKDYAIAKGGTIKNCYYYHSEPRFGGATYNGELYKDGNKFTVISKTQKVMGTGEVTWLLNENGKNDIWRQKAIGSADISLNKSYGRVKQNTDGTYSIVTPHIHRLDNGTQTEFKEVHSLDEITGDTSDTKYYCLSKDVTLSAAWEAPNRDIMLCLNGKSITAPNDVSAITVGTDSTFTLMDCGKGKISGGSYGIEVTGGTFNLHSGEISGNTTGVLLNSGRCTLNGGSITKNTTGVDYLDGTLTLSGGAKVIENQGGEENKTKNILLHTGKTLSFGKLDADARFGISVENLDSSEASIPVTDATGGKYFNNLFPDDVLTNELYRENGVVWLRTQGHTAHCVCGGTHNTAIVNHTEENKLNFQPWNPYATNPAKPQMPTSMPEGVDGYYLTRDVTLNSTWSPSNVVLCLNGHKMTFSGNGFVEISGNGKLTLTDCGTTGKLCREGSEVYKKGGISLSTGSTFDMYGGTITGFQHGVSTDQVGGTIHLYGGTITGNETVHGAGVFCWGSSSNPSTFIMYGGKITNNHATYSGSDTKVKPSGGGVFLREYSKFEMYGGEITGNTATYGGGVYCGAIISPNTAEMILHGGKITDNTATYGGGVYFKDKAFQVTGKGKVTITDNTGNGGKNVVLFDGKIIQVTGKLHEDTRIGVRSFHNPTDGNPITIAKATDGGWIQKGNFTSDIPDYGIALLDDGKTVQLQTHQHSWEYIVSQDGTTITEHCTAENCGLPEDNGGSVTIKAPADNLIYDGQGKAAVLENTLISGVSVSEIAYTKNGTDFTGTPTDAGTYTAAVTVGGEKATVQYTIAQSGTEFSGGVTVTRWNKVYNYGDPIYVTVTPKATGNAPIRKVRALSTPQAGQMAIYEGDRQLTEAQTVTSGKELTFTIDTAKANLERGKHTLTAKFVESQNMATQIGTVDVTITWAWITNANVVVEGKSFTYTGSPVTPAVSVTLKNGTQLMKDRDYTLAYTNHTNAGTATVTVTGQGNYTGEATRTFVISKAAAPEISWPTASAITCGEKVSDSSLSGGSTQYGTFAWSDTVKDTTPAVGTYSYKVVFTPSKATKNNYETITTTERDVSLTVNAKSLNDAHVTVSGSYIYTGQAQIPAADAVTVQVDGKIIPKDRYTISASDNTNAGQAIVTVTGKGDYIGTASGTFTIGKATPNPTIPTELNAVYGSTLKDVPLPNGWAWDTPDSSVGNVGEKTFAATYTEDNSGNYNTVQKNLTVKVAKKTVTVTALDKNAYIGSDVPALSNPEAGKDYKVEGLVGTDTLNGTVTLTYAQTPNMSKAGKTTINITGTLSNDNYDIIYANGTLTVSNRPSGGGGGGGGGSKPTKKPTEKPAEKPAVSPTVDGKNDTVKIAETTAEANTAAANAAKSDDKVTLVTEGTNVSGKDFANPAVLKIPADTKDVKNVKNLTLAKLNAETGKLEIVGGSYDAKANAVVGYVAEEGSYFVVEKEGLTTISMQIGNKHVALNNENKILDAAPLISQNRTMVPLRFIAETFGADVSWAQDTKTVTIVIDGKVLTMRINQDLEGFGAAPIISNGRTMVPISYISKELGANVIWVPSTKTVAIARYAYTDFDSMDKMDRYRLMDLSARYGNRDGAALRYVAERLLKQPEEKKLLLLVSDGQPAGTGGYLGSAAEADLRGIKKEYPNK